MDPNVLKAVGNLVSQTNAIAQQQNEVKKKQDPVQAQPVQDPAANKALNGLSQILGAANSAAPETDEKLADLQKEAALIKARVNDLIAYANQLEENLNLAPTPEAVDVGELFEDFKGILEQLQSDMNDLQAKMAEKEEQDSMDVTQKPTNFKPGEDVTSLSFNTTAAIQ